ncbi:MAG: RDD family protein [Paracoccaceae bacterium]|nr:RDD family protein [Paracoccaceae bacterium]
MYSDPIDHLPDPVRQPGFYADVPVKRGIAWVIDLVIIMVLVVPVVILTAFIGMLFLPFLYLVVGFLYRWFTIAGGSATWGMRMMAIEFRDSFGRRLDSQQALLHTLGYTVSISIVPVQIVSIILMFTSERGQGVTDMVLGTTALNRRA